MPIRNAGRRTGHFGFSHRPLLRIGCSLANTSLLPAGIVGCGAPLSGWSDVTNDQAVRFTEGFVINPASRKRVPKTYVNRMVHRPKFERARKNLTMHDRLCARSQQDHCTTVTLLRCQVSRATLSSFVTGV